MFKIIKEWLKERSQSRPDVKKIYRFFVIVIGLLLLVSWLLGILLGATGIFESEESDVSSVFVGGWLGIGFGLTIVTAFVITAWRWYDPFPADFIGFRRLFEEPIEPILTPGIYFAPLGITDVKKFRLPVRQVQYPAEDEKIFKGEYEDGVAVSQIPEGMKPPIRITFAEGTTPKEVERKIGMDDMTALDLYKMEVGSVKSVVDPHRLRRAIKDGAEQTVEAILEKAKRKEPLSYWGDLSYKELRHLEEMGLVFHELEEKRREGLDDFDEKLYDSLLDCMSGGRVHTITLNPKVTKPAGRRGQKAEETGIIGLERRVTAEVILVVRWTIVDPIDFFKNIGDDDAVNKQIEDEMVSVISRLLPRISVGLAYQNIAWINSHLYMAVIKRTLTWGIRVENVFMKNILLHHTLNDAIAELPEADYKGQSAKIIAIREGEGKARAAFDLEHETLRGRAKGMRAIQVDLSQDGEVVSATEVQRSEVARDLAEGGNTIVVGSGGFQDLVGLAAANFTKDKRGNKDSEGDSE